MKKKNRILSLVMAFVLAFGCIGQMGGQVVFANQELLQPPISVTGQPEVKDKLTKGDKFTAWIYINTSGIGGDKFSKYTQVVEVGGSARQTNSANVQIQPNVGGDDNKGAIILHDLEYTGKGDSVNVVVQYDETPENTTLEYEYLETTIQLSNTEEIIQAGVGLSMSSKTMNVVAGETQQIEITFKNESGSPTEEAEIKLEMADKTASKGIKIKKDKHSIGRLEKGESKSIFVTLEIDEKIARGKHIMKVNIGGIEQELTLKVDSNFMPPSLQVEMDYKGSFQENTPQAVNLNVTNVGHVAAKNVTVKLTGESVFVTNGSNIKYVENIESGKTAKVPVTLMVSDTSKYTVPLALELKYIDDQGKEQISSQVINLSTKGSVVQKELGLTTTTEPQGAVKIGESFNIGFNLTAPDGAENVTITVDAKGGIVPKSKSIFIEPKLTPGQKKSYNVTFVAPDEVTTGTYPISMTAAYALNGKDVEIKTYATVLIDNPKKDEGDEEGKGKGQPKVIIGHYSSDPVVVKAGEEFNLEVGFLNTHTTQTITNFKANLTVVEKGENDTGSVFTPVAASNTFFIPELAPGQSEVKNIRLYTLPNAKPKTYEVTLEMTYDDANGNEVKANEFIGIPVEQVTKLEVAEVNVEMVEVGMESELSATIYNTGKTDISNVMISITGEGFTAVDSKKFEGLFKQGSQLIYDPTLIPNQSGIINGQILIEYEDATGQVLTMAHDFEMEVMEPMVMPDMDFEGDMGMEEPEPVQGINWPMMLGGVMGVGIAAGITTLVLKKRRRKLEEMAIDED